MLTCVPPSFETLGFVLKKSRNFKSEHVILFSGLVCSKLKAQYCLYLGHDYKYY